MFPDYEQTGLIYHNTPVDNLLGIFSQGLIVRRREEPEDQHHTIYDTLYRYRPAYVPEWVDPRNCIFGFLNRKRYGLDKVVDGSPFAAVLAIQATGEIAQRIWVALTAFSDWVYCPKEAGYLDFPEREKYYREAIEPTCAEAYWRTSLSFEENLKIRHDHLLATQGYLELLICADCIPTSSLSLEALVIEGSDGRAAVMRGECPELFRRAELLLRAGREAYDELAFMAARFL